MVVHREALIKERTQANLVAARARGRHGGRKPKMTPALVDKAPTHVRLARSPLALALMAERIILDPQAGGSGGHRRRYTSARWLTWETVMSSRSSSRCIRRAICEVDPSPAWFGGHH